MKFGIRLSSDIGHSASLIRLGVLAEKCGFDFCWVPHDLFKRSCFPTLTAVAMETKTIKLGPAIVNPYTMDPSEIAMFAATLDELVPSRVVVGLSAGALEFFSWIGLKTRSPVRRTREAVLLIRKVLNGENAQFAGLEFHWTNQAYLRVPAPKQLIPIYVGGQGREMLRLAGEVGNGALPILFPPTFARTAVERIAAGAKDANRDVSAIDIAGCVWFSISEDAGIAKQAIKRLAAYYGPTLSEDVLSSTGLNKQYFREAEKALLEGGIDSAVEKVDDRVLDLAIAGRPSECIEGVAELQKAGVQQVSIGPPLGPDPESAVRLIGKFLIPYFGQH